MSGYRRFVAYVYEYVQDMKGANKGYIKVEVKNENCKMQFHLQGEKYAAEIKCYIYGFVREGLKCRMLELGQCNLAGEQVEFELEIPETRIAGSQYALSDLAGIILRGENNICYLTQWDDAPISMEDFLLQEEEPEMQAEEVKMPEEDWSNWDYQPFGDDEFICCKKITLQEVSLRNNFLLHGYEQFRHLLLGKVQEKEEYILGVPGIYEPQEKFMAGVFGFPYFKAAKMDEKIQAAFEQPVTHQFGYWYRLIQASDFHCLDCFF